MLQAIWSCEPKSSSETSCNREMLLFLHSISYTSNRHSQDFLFDKYFNNLLFKKLLSVWKLLNIFALDLLFWILALYGKLISTVGFLVLPSEMTLRKTNT
jgi:hypothetical protein